MKTFTVNAEKPYKVTVSHGYGDFDYDNNFLKALILTDDNVAPLYLEDVKKLFSCRIYTCVIKSGEFSKSTDGFEKVIKTLIGNDFNRNDLLVCLGGGVVGDLGGFVASVYLRGIRYVQMPTTLLSAIDSSVGGKTGIDFGGLKNSIGTFYSPDYVYVNLDTLKTLPKTQIDNGNGELLKYSFLTKSVCLTDDTENIVYSCLKYKAEIIERDERDVGLRAILNLGHTVGHAVEELSGYNLSHGLCVYKGIISAIKISAKLYGFDKNKTERLLSEARKANLDETIDYEKEVLLAVIKKDKKVTGDKIKFITVYDAGDCRIETLSLEKLEKLL